MSDVRAQTAEAEKNGGKVFVGNLKRTVYKDDLLDMFKDHGKVLSVWIAQQPPGFAFVTFSDPEDAKDAVSACNGKDVDWAERGGVRVEVSSNAGGGKGRGKGGRKDSRRKDSRRRGGGRDSGRADSRKRGGRRGDSRRRR